MEFKFKHEKSGELKKFSLSEEKIQDMIEDELYDMLHCDCQPIGETNVVECNCEDYYEGFVLLPRALT